MNSPVYPVALAETVTAFAVYGFLEGAVMMWMRRTLIMKGDVLMWMRRTSVMKGGGGGGVVDVDEENFDYEGGCVDVDENFSYERGGGG